MLVNTRVALVLPNQRRMRRACLPSASCDRSSGILWSSASPVYDTNAVGITSVTWFGVTRLGARIATICAAIGRIT